MASRPQRAAAHLLSACVLALASASTGASAAEEPQHPASLDEAIIKSAARHGIPESLVRRIVMRESKYNPLARNHRYWGLMQISYGTAKSMGFKGTPQELLNPVVNLRYAVPYLANAFVVAGRRQDAAVRLYAAGYYDTAKRRGLLGMLRTAESAPVSGSPDEPDQVANLAPPAPPPQDAGIFGALFGPGQMQRQEQPQQVASADPSQVVAASQPAAAPVAASTPSTRSEGLAGKPSDDVALVADKHGNLQPPKKWLHDGGSTVIARGEQPVERVAAFDKSADARSSRGRHHKFTVFASLDQPASAQAYAASGSQDPRLTEAASQAAITQATSGQPTPDAQQPQQAVAAPTVAAPQAKVAEDDTKTKARKGRVAHRSRHKDAPEAAVAQAPTPQQEAPVPEGQPRADGAAMAPAPQPQQAAGEPQPQPAQLDASGYPVDAGARPTEAAEAAPRTKKRHVAHRARPHKTAVAAVQDDKAPATTAQQ